MVIQAPDNRSGKGLLKQRRSHREVGAFSPAHRISASPRSLIGVRRLAGVGRNLIFRRRLLLSTYPLSVAAVSNYSIFGKGFGHGKSMHSSSGFAMLVCSSNQDGDGVLRRLRVFWDGAGRCWGGDGCANLRWRLFGLDCGVGDVEGAIDASFVFCCR